MQTDGDKGSCPVSFCSNLPLERKVPVVAGGLIVILSFMAMAAEGLIWLLVLLGGLMVYGGMTGNCLLTKAICHLCGKKTDCDSMKGSCDSNKKGGCGS